MRALALLLVLSACAASPLKQHATAADVAADAITAAGEQITRTWRVAELQAVEGAETQEDAIKMVGVVRERFAPLALAYEATRRAHEAYVQAIVRANARDTPVPAEVLAALVKAWRELLARASAEALTLGGVPAPLDHLARGPP